MHWEQFSVTPQTHSAELTFIWYDEWSRLRVQEVQRMRIAFTMTISSQQNKWLNPFSGNKHPFCIFHRSAPSSIELESQQFLNYRMFKFIYNSCGGELDRSNFTMCAIVTEKLSPSAIRTNWRLCNVHWMAEVIDGLNAFRTNCKWIIHFYLTATRVGKSSRKKTFANRFCSTNLTRMFCFFLLSFSFTISW